MTRGPDTPRVSVVIPCHDRAETIDRAVASALGQSFDDLEVIVVDDGSTDGTADRVAALDDPRVRVLRVPARRGAAAARNTGIESAAGEWIAFLDSDDEWLPDRLRLHFEALHGGAVADAGFCLLRERYEPGGRTTEPIDALPEGDILDDLLAGRRPTSTTAFMATRAALRGVGGFDETMPTAHDIDLWLRLARAGHRFTAVNEVQAVRHRDHGPQVSTDPARRWRGYRLFHRKWARLMRERIGTERYLRWRVVRSGKLLRMYRRVAGESLRSGRPVAALVALVPLVRLLWSHETARAGLALRFPPLDAGAAPRVSKDGGIHAG